MLKNPSLAVLLAIGLGFGAAACGGGSEIEFTSSGKTTGTGATGGTGGSGGTGATGGTGGTGGEMLNCVIDGKVNAPEECDDGNDIPGDGCENDCSFTCTKGTVNGDAKCDDADPCNGSETCSAEHKCEQGAPPADGTACGNNQICKLGVCGDITCGDLFVDPGEDCDDGNVDPTDGCDACKFTCIADADCAPADVCAGSGVCAADHTCSNGAPLPDGTVCQGGFCAAGVCTPPMCGDGSVQGTELCDDGNLVDGDGCDADCTFSCAVPATDCAAPAPCNMQTCSAQHTCVLAPDPAQDGLSCGPGLTCQNGSCAVPSAVCGNGVTEMGEDCDFGAGNGPGTGCEGSCTFSCTKAPDSCPDANACNGVEACTNVIVGGKTGQKCSAGSPLADCSACAGGLCAAGTCVASTCGDACVDLAAGEQCEPPGTATCDAACKAIAPAVCGNGVREGNEQCDDGGQVNLDGCDGNCRFEQSQRATYLSMQFGVDQFCTKNGLGSAITGGTAQSQLQQALNTGVADGSIGVVFKFLGLDDLSGTSDPQLEIGVLNGTPETLGGALMYNGTSDLDWWQNIDPLGYDATRTPTALLPGNITAKVLTGGPGTVLLNLILGGAPAALKMSNTKFTISVGAASTPLSSAGNPPGHLASEHLDPALTSFASCGQPNANGAGKMCGDVSAASLANVPIPAALAGSGILNCSQQYAVTNSLLDVLVGGCTIFFVQQIKPTQPDTVDASLPVLGGGGPYQLSANAQKVVSTCRDKNNAVVNFNQCMNTATYSAFFKFASGRVIAK